ncbi:MAG: tetratricopeptide repeat protein [Candidatus Eisenbacteria bacterium]|nr:tetratricopeptide repeat protein [Candidatus Eisenbacteria bacterium]
MNRAKMVLRATAILLVPLWAAPAAGSGVPAFDEAAALILRGDAEAALARYEGYLEKEPESRHAPVAAMAIANLQLRVRADTAAAEAALDRILDDYRATPFAPEAAREKGACARTRGEWTAAGESFRLAAELGSNRRARQSDDWLNEVTLSAADCFERAGDRAKVIDTYEKVIEASPPPEVASSAYFHLGEAYEEEGDEIRAAEQYARVIENYPSTGGFQTALEKRGLIERHREVDWAPVELLLEARDAAGTDFDASILCCEKVLGSTKNEAYVQCAEYGKIFAETMRSADYSEGCRKLREYLDRWPNGLQSERGRLILDAHWTPIADWEEQAKANPDDPETVGRLGALYIRARQWERAAETLERAIALAPDDEGLHLQRGYALAGMGRPEEALASFSVYLDAHPNDTGALNQIGYTYIGMGRPEESVTYFRRYAEAAPEEANSHDSYGEGLLLSGRAEEALAQYERAVELDPNFSNSWFMLGRVNREMGRDQKAIEAYETFLEQSPNGPQADEAREAIREMRAK